MFLLSTPDPASVPPTDFWGIVVPGYIGAIGGLISAVIGAVALIQSLRARGGVRSIAAGLNAEQRAEPAADAIEIPDDANAASAPRTEHRESLTWAIRKSSGDQYRLMNRSQTVTATLTGIIEVSEGDDLTLDPSAPLPADIPPQGQYAFYLARTFTSPAVTALRIEWIEPGRGTQFQTLYP